MDLMVNGVEQTNLSLEAVTEHLKLAESINDLELWLSHKDGASMTALLNASRGWLLYTIFDPDKCLRTQNSSIVSTETDSYNLSNGQKDVYPNSYAYPRKVIFAALGHFVRSEQLDPSLNWVDGMV